MIAVMVVFFDGDHAHRSMESRGSQGQTINFVQEQDISFPAVEVEITRRSFFAGGEYTESTHEYRGHDMTFCRVQGVEFTLGLELSW